jgi:hypothetical protein
MAIQNARLRDAGEAENKEEWRDKKKSLRGNPNHWRPLSKVARAVQ